MWDWLEKDVGMKFWKCGNEILKCGIENYIFIFKVVVVEKSVGMKCGNESSKKWTKYGVGMNQKKCGNENKIKCGNENVGMKMWDWK